MMAVWQNIPVTEVVGYLGTGGSGGSRPILLRTEGGETVHVKLQLNPQSTRSLANDWIGTLLGKSLGAPFLDVRLVRIRWEQLGQLPFLLRSRWHPGLQFGTAFLAGAEKVTAASIGNLDNLDDLPLAALTESWLFNLDLKSSHILAVPGAAGHRLVLTDHGFIFPYGPNWSLSDLARYRRQFPAVKPLTVLAMAAPRRFSFHSALQATGSVTRQDLADLLNSVPQEWGLSARRKEAILSFLLFRQNRLKRVAEYLEALWNQGKPVATESAKSEEPEEAEDPEGREFGPVAEDSMPLETEAQGKEGEPDDHEDSARGT